MEVYLSYGQCEHDQKDPCNASEEAMAERDCQGARSNSPCTGALWGKASSSMMDALFKEYGTLIDVVRSSIEKMKPALFKYSMTIGLTNKDGVILLLEGAGENNHFDLGIGSILTERCAIRSVVKMCIESGHPASVLAEEPSACAFKKTSRFAAPIYDETGDLYAVLFACTHGELSGRDTMGLLLLAAGGIEKEWILSKQNYEMQMVIKSLSRFDEEIAHTASLLSHEVRNSLSTISAYIQLLQLQQVLDHQRAEKILGEVNRVSKLLNGFKTLARPMRFRFSRYSLKEILQNIVETMRPQAQMQNVEIQFLADDGDLRIYGDKDSLCQVFVNLILNAIQAMEQGGRLTIRIGKKSSDKVMIEFTDTGIGIPKQNLPDIFKAFFTTKKNGTGLGLPLCQNIIRSHGGSITVDSVLGAGTTFTIELPLSP